MKIIGLVGGVASGKSFVAEQFARLGAVRLDADRAGHAVLDDPAVKAAIRERFGAEVFDATGRVDRRALGRVVFSSNANGGNELQYLVGITHPPIGERLRREAAEAAAAGKSAAVLDAPLLLESGWRDWCDHVVYVDAARDVRLSRAAGRGWSEAEFSAREAAQDSLDEKRRQADFVINNSGSAESTAAQVDQLWRSLFDGSTRSRP